MRPEDCVRFFIRACKIMGLLSEPSPKSNFIILRKFTILRKYTRTANMENRHMERCIERIKQIIVD